VHLISSIFTLLLQGLVKLAQSTSQHLQYSDCTITICVYDYLTSTCWQCHIAAIV